MIMVMMGCFKGLPSIRKWNIFVYKIEHGDIASKQLLEIWEMKKVFWNENNFLIYWKVVQMV